MNRSYLRQNGGVLELLFIESIQQQYIQYAICKRRGTLGMCAQL